MKRFVASVLVVALLLCLSQTVYARGEGWEDVFWGSLFGTGFGTILGGVSLAFYPSQAECDAHIYNIAIGAGAGLVAGATYGALIGWPKRTQLVLAPSASDPGGSAFVGVRKEF